MGRHKKDGNYIRGEEWLKRQNKHLSCNCAKCGKGGLKNTMPALYIRPNSHTSMKVLCHLCPDCLPLLLDYLGVEMPEWEGKDNG